MANSICIAEIGNINDQFLSKEYREYVRFLLLNYIRVIYMKSSILLERKEFVEIQEILALFPEAQYCEVSVEHVAGLGKITNLIIPTKIQDLKNKDLTAKMVITITDENDW